MGAITARTTTRETRSIASPGSIGPLGTAARIIVGVVLLAITLVWRDPTWTDVAESGTAVQRDQAADADTVASQSGPERR